MTDKSKIHNNNLTLSLKCGRQLGFAEYGDPDGRPVFFFHGMGIGSRLDAHYLHRAALLNHYRLISIDRPGIGLSSIDKNRTVLSWANDVEEFADLLNIKKFSIIGHSGGALFTAACAYKIPNRLTGVAIVSGVAPFEIFEDSLFRGQRFLNKAINTMPWVATLMMKIMFIMSKSPGMLKYIMKQLPEVDQLAVRSQCCDKELAQSLREPFRQGIAGTSQELQLVVKPCGFDLTNIKLECPITIWHGGLDKQVPLMRAKLYAKLIPNAKLYFFEDEGHTSLLINKGDHILRGVDS